MSLPASPQSSSVNSKQYELFTSFVTNDSSQLSNTIDFWDSIPKYHLTAYQVKKLSVAEGLAHASIITYQYKQNTYVLRIQAAQIKKDGREKSYFPGVTEELVEDALRKLLSDQQHGFHDPIKKETWIKFSINKIKKELDGDHLNRRKSCRDIRADRSNDIKHSRSTDQIKHALTVLNRSILTICKDDEELWSGSILQNLTLVSREKYQLNHNKHHIAQLPPFISLSINNGEYRQINYVRLMSLKLPLSRWLFKRLVNRYKQACITLNYNILFSTIESDSGLLKQGTNRDNRKKVLATLKELKIHKILMSYELDIRKEGKKISDINYIMTTTNQFTQEQKASNKRSSGNKTHLFK